MSADLAPPYCDFHGNDEHELANAVCIKHQKLMCHSCSLEKARSSESCIILPTSKIPSDKDSLVKYLQMKQNLCTKRLQLQAHEKTAIEVKNKLKNGVTEVHSKIANYLNELKTESFKSVDSKYDDITRDLNDKLASLDLLEAELNSNLEQIVTDVDVDILKFKSNALDLESKLVKKLDENPGIPDGEFQSDKDLENAIFKCKNGLGEINVQVIEEDGYEPVRLFGNGLHRPKESENDWEDCSGEENNPPQIPPRRSQILSGQLNDPSENLIVKSGTGYHDHDDVSAASETSIIQLPTRSKDPKRRSKSQADDARNCFTTQAGDVKQSGKNMMFDKIRTKDKKAIKQELYEDFELTGSRRAHPRYLINKSISVSGLTSFFKSACKFSKLIPLGTDRLGLFSEIHSIVVVTDFNGTIHSSLSNYSGLKSFVAIEDDQLAVMTQEDGPTIKIFHVCGKRFENKSSIDLKIDKSDITGFDYYKNKKRYAISTAANLIVTDAKGKKMKTAVIENVTGSSDIATTYDFENDFIYVLNKTRKTFKCVSLKKMEAIWKRKCDMESVEAKGICLYKDKLCIAFSSSIAVLAAKDGIPIQKHDTFDLLGNCLGMCIIEDVIVVSSDSDEFGESTKLAFISV